MLFSICCANCPAISMNHKKDDSPNERKTGEIAEAISPVCFFGEVLLTEILYQ